MNYGHAKPKLSKPEQDTINFSVYESLSEAPNV
jgi:hypothetical protein